MLEGATPFVQRLSICGTCAPEDGLAAGWRRLPTSHKRNAGALLLEPLPAESRLPPLSLPYSFRV